MPLTPKQQRFVDEYLVDLNATRAAVRAGYSGRNADKIGPELLGKTRVAAAIAAATEARKARTGVDQDWVIGKLVENVNRAMQAEPVLDSEGCETGQYQYKGAVANKALELLGRHLGMFADKLDVNHSGAVSTVHIYMPPNGRDATPRAG